MVRAALLASILVLAGCASVSDIDTSQLEPACAQACTARYSECLGKFTLFPIQAQHQCTDAMHLCAKSCPTRTVDAVPASNTQRLSDLNDLYKRGLITKDEYDTKRATIIQGL
ncbi:hypothetical protein BCh11DRAFT_07706 [Burkholderia sp. Ch1-1]|jgi:hypothetical protein|nr:hypothetical protein BCh11DRAFT_07706 [Burkholderia sp. Ch1-1]MBK5124982.1 SHOCT domain-containing protein [Burkholderia sp. R-69980]